MLDQDQDGKVTVDDLKECLRRNNLSQDYAHQFISRARGARWWASSITYASWLAGENAKPNRTAHTYQHQVVMACRFEEFKSMIDDSESKMLRAFCNLDVDKDGSLDMVKIKGAHPHTRKLV